MKLLIFLLPILLYPTVNAFFFLSSILVTIEKHWYRVGESVEIYCQTTDGVSNDLYFSELLSGIPLNDENYTVKVINEDTIQLQLYNVTAGKYNYICQNNKSEKTLLNIGVASFEVGYPPEIKDIVFEIIDFKELNVHMSPKVKDLNEYWKTTWKFGEDIEEPMSDGCLCLNASQNCLCLNPFNCSISEGSCFNPNRTYQFTILGSNHFGLVNKTYIISPMKEVEELENQKRLVGVSSLSLSWSWKVQDLWPSTTVECKISYKTYETGEWKSYFTNSNEVTRNDFVPNKIYTCSSV